MATTSIYDAAADDAVGGNVPSDSFDDIAYFPEEGDILWSQVRDSSNNLVSFFDARTIPEGSRSFTDALGNTWDLYGDSEIIAYTTETIVIKGEAIAKRTNIMEYDNDGAHQPITGLAIIGQGEGNDQKLIFIQDTQSGTVPLWEGKMTLKDQGDETLLIERGEFCIDNSNDVNRQYTLTLDPELEPGHDDITVGENVRLVIKDKFTQEDAFFWIGRKKVTLTKEQDELVTLEVTQ